MSYLGENIKNFRKKKGLTIKELSLLCKSSVSSISQIETGKRDATFGLLVKISNGLEMDISDLVAAPEKIPFEHNIGMAINFDDYKLVIGHTKRDTYSEFYNWGIVVDMSEGKLIDVLQFSSYPNSGSKQDFFTDILLPYILEQRLALLINHVNINVTYNEIKEKGISWDDLVLLIRGFNNKLKTNKYNRAEG